MSRDAGTSAPPAERIVRLGLVSDTHGLFHPELEEAFRGVDAILHAGDVGSREVLSGLDAASVVARRAATGGTARARVAEAIENARARLAEAERTITT